MKFIGHMSSLAVCYLCPSIFPPKDCHLQMIRQRWTFDTKWSLLRHCSEPVSVDENSLHTRPCLCDYVGFP